VKVSIDTNILVRIITVDDESQAQAARRLLAEAELIAVPLYSFCELVWVLGTGYGYDRKQIAVALETLLETTKLVLDRAAVDAGLELLYAGADFADGVIAFEGTRLGGETFVSFDMRAVRALTKLNRSAKLLST
jgi:predicted nucleic-acid-binding protein